MWVLWIEVCGGNLSLIWNWFLLVGGKNCFGREVEIMKLSVGGVILINKFNYGLVNIKLRFVW